MYFSLCLFFYVQMLRMKEDTLYPIVNRTLSPSHSLSPSTSLPLGSAATEPRDGSREMPLRCVMAELAGPSYWHTLQKLNYFLQQSIAKILTTAAPPHITWYTSCVCNCDYINAVFMLCLELLAGQSLQDSSTDGRLLHSYLEVRTLWRNVTLRRAAQASPPVRRELLASAYQCLHSSKTLFLNNVSSVNF